MSNAEISQWCTNHPYAWVEMVFSNVGIELKMFVIFGSIIKRKISYTELNSTKTDIICLNLDEMYINLM